MTFAAGAARLITAIPGISDNLTKSEQYWLCFVSQVLDGKWSIIQMAKIHVCLYEYIYEYVSLLFHTGLGNPLAMCITTKVCMFEAYPFL